MSMHVKGISHQAHMYCMLPATSGYKCA